MNNSTAAAAKQSPTESPRGLRVDLRWMIRRDMPEVVAIEQASYECPWDEEEFWARLRSRNTIGMVAERDGVVVALMIYEIYKDRIELINLAVHPDHRRLGIGAALLHKLQAKLSPDYVSTRRNTVECCVCEANLDGHLFMQSMGFRCVGIWPDWYDDGSSAYRFVFHRNWLSEAAR